MLYRNQSGYEKNWFYSKWKDKVLEYKGIKNLLALLKIKLPKNNILTIFQVYTPMTATEEEEMTTFYDVLGE